MAADSGTLALLSGRGEPVRVGPSGESWVGTLDWGGRTISGDEDGGNDKGEESDVGCDMAIVFVSVTTDFGACFCGVWSLMSVEVADCSWSWRGDEG
jgi:hypothetical protein